MTTAAIHTNVIAGETPTLSPFASASPDDLDKQHELGQFLTPNPVAELMTPPPFSGNTGPDLPWWVRVGRK